MRDERERVFSGVQPDGALHLGNLLGAIRHWVAGQDATDGFFCVVDLHAITSPWHPEELRRLTLGTGALLMACGIDPSRSVLFVQSHVSEHTELAWVLTCIARMGELRRMVQFKEKSKGETESVGAGLFTYPVLQAADVLLYKAHGVPVGEDQRQHIELMRDLAHRFNSAFGATFIAPEPRIPPAGARIMALDDPTQKMSKSAPNPASKILLVDDADVIARKIKSAVTDSGREVRAEPGKPAISNLLAIFSALTGEPVGDLEARFASAGYGEFKSALTDALVDHLAPIRARYDRYMSDVGETERILLQGAKAASAVAERTMAEVRARIGLRARDGL